MHFRPDIDRKLAVIRHQQIFMFNWIGSFSECICNRGTLWRRNYVKWRKRSVIYRDAFIYKWMSYLQDWLLLACLWGEEWQIYFYISWNMQPFKHWVGEKLYSSKKKPPNPQTKSKTLCISFSCIHPNTHPLVHIICKIISWSTYLRIWFNYFTQKTI